MHNNVFILNVYISKYQSAELSHKNKTNDNVLNV